MIYFDKSIDKRKRDCVILNFGEQELYIGRHPESDKFGRGTGRFGEQLTLVSTKLLKPTKEMASPLTPENLEE